VCVHENTILFLYFAMRRQIIIKFVLIKHVNSHNLSRVRIKDIARLAGVSAGTVDRVLHNRGEVSEKTRNRILAIIRNSDYQPDLLASTLAAKKGFRLAALIPGGTADNQFWNYPLKGIEEGLREIMHFGVSLEKYCFNFFDRDEFLHQAARMLDNDPQGVIIAPVFTPEATELLNDLGEKNIPAVLINANICTGSCLAFIGQDSIQSGMVAGRIMHYGTGDDADILIVNFMRDNGRQDHILKREEGFRKYFRDVCGRADANLRQLNIDEKPGNNPEKLLQDAIDSSGRPPKGIFVTNSKVFRVARFLEKIPGKIILIGYDLLDENKYFLRKGTIDFLISQKPQEQGYKSIMTLYHHLVLKKEVEKNQYLPIDIITRENLEHYSFA
jgi:LacI family transcriptional regulator